MCERALPGFNSTARRGGLRRLRLFVPNPTATGHARAPASPSWPTGRPRIAPPPHRHQSARDPARGPVWAAVAEARRLVPASRRPSRVHEQGRSLAGELIDADLRRASCRRVRAAGREGEADTWSARSELRLQAVRPPGERIPNVRPAVLHRCCTESPSMDGNRRKPAVFRGNDLQRAQKQVAPPGRGQVVDLA